jgi:predicted nucleic acid-binding protein
MTLIDTSAWIEFFRSKADTALKSRVADLISFGEAAYTCPIRFELFLGARAKELKDLQTGLGFARRVMLAPQHWNTAAALGAKLRSAGHSIPASDLLIAVVAHSEDLPLLGPRSENEIAKGEVFYNYERLEDGNRSEELPGFSVFYRNEAGEIFNTYSGYARAGDILIGAYNYLDHTPKGRNERETLDWVRCHDSYELRSASHDETVPTSAEAALLNG